MDSEAQQKDLLLAVSEDTGRVPDPNCYEFSRDAYRYCMTLLCFYEEGRYPPNAPPREVVGQLCRKLQMKFHETAPKNAFGKTRLTFTESQRAKFTKLILKRFGGDYGPLIEQAGSLSSSSPLFRNATAIKKLQAEIAGDLKNYRRLDFEQKHSLAKNPLAVFGLMFYAALLLYAIVIRPASFSIAWPISMALIGAALFYLYSRKSYAQLQQELGELAGKIASNQNKYWETARTLDELRLEGQKGDEWWRSLKGYALEEELEKMLKSRGFETSLTSRSNDGGVDIFATVGNRKYLIQCKGWSSKVGVPAVRELAGVVTSYDCEVTGVVVGTNGFTAEARNFASQSGVRLWDATKLAHISSTGDL